MNAGIEVIVVGGGIAGLTMALSLHQAGIAVRVYEAVREPHPLGLGINLQPSAVRELTELGLGDDLAQTAIATQRLNLYNKLGQLISSEPKGLCAGYKWPQYSLHRGQLQMLLLRVVRERIGKNNVRCGLRLAALEQKQNRVAAMFRDEKSATIVFDDADILVGADGLHSVVRHHLHSAEGAPRFARQILWRGAVASEPFLGGATMIIAGHFDQRVVVYPVGRGSEPGRLLTNWVCLMTVPQEMPIQEAWNQRIVKQNALAPFATWRFPWLDLPALIERTPDIYEFPLMDRDPVQTWTQGRVTLIGDAAHPMQPTGSQAGSQAIVDARLLTSALLAGPDPLEALQLYDAQRRPIMNDITLRNRHLGPEAAIQLVEDRAPNGFVRVEDVVGRETLDAITKTYSNAAGLDASTVNNRPSLVQTGHSL
jgi:5-methylphenazine-1-carboxylate 1-monooxygenase